MCAVFGSLSPSVLRATQSKGSITHFSKDNLEISFDVRGFVQYEKHCVTQDNHTILPLETSAKSPAHIKWHIQILGFRI